MNRRSQLTKLSNTQIDRIGERLRAGSFTEDDLRSLDEYRRSFAPAFELVFGMLQESLSIAPTGRPEKSRKSLSEKLLRESARLSQVQDIAGCRVVVRGIVEQDDAVGRIQGAFERVLVVDRRVRPSHGYRAVHAMVAVLGRTIEVQVRTELQHLWAELSEKLSDRFGVEVKYGGGAENVRATLFDYSGLVAEVDDGDKELVAHTAKLVALTAKLSAVSHPPVDLAVLEDEVLVLQKQNVNLREELKRRLRLAIAELG